MSDLKLALIALGVVIIAGVVMFNWWQERRFVRDSIRRFDGPVDDALMQDFRIEPGSFSDSESIVVEEVFEEDAVTPEPVVAQEPPAQPEIPPAPPSPVAEAAIPEIPATQPVAETPPEPAPAAPVTAPRAVVDTQPAGLDERIDLIANLQAEETLPAAAILKFLQGMPKFDHPVHCRGLTEAGVWLPVVPGEDSAHFKHIACALQLADCSGPVVRATLEAFGGEMENLATMLGAELQWQGPADPLGYAAELDQFCVEVDVMVGFHVMHGPNGPFAGTKLRGLAEAQGMKLHDDGAFHFEGDDGATLFTLVSQDQRPFRTETLRSGFYRGISFQLDVPRSSRCTDAFNQMVLLARQLEIGLDGTLVDDNQRHLGDVEIGKIRQQLDLLNARMLERGIVPGSPTALRLFS